MLLVRSIFSLTTTYILGLANKTFLLLADTVKTWFLALVRVYLISIDFMSAPSTMFLTSPVTPP